MNARDFLNNNTVILDGGMGTLLQGAGLPVGEHPEHWNITHPDVVKNIHKSYFDAGSNVVNTNTFGANSLKFTHNELKEIISHAVSNAKQARDESDGTQPKFISLDIGPTGKLLKPYGELDFEDAVAVFAEVVRLGAKCGVDLVTVETMNDSYETKAALLAVKENCDLPVIVTNAYGEDGKLMTGASPEAMVAMLEGMGADAIGANCSLGPKQLSGVVDRLLSCASVPVVVKPNAGLPSVVDGKTVYDVDAPEFARDVSEMIKKGVRVAGGCCGTTPEYIRELAKKARDIPPAQLTDKKLTVVSSYTHAVTFGNSPVLIGERINPTGKKKLKQALIDNDMDYILGEGLGQADKGAHVLDVNVGLPDIDEVAMLSRTVTELQAITDLPLQIDTSNALAMESALRRYNGKPMINSVNGKTESMREIFPLVKKYGGVVVALTLDENGIPDTAEGRIDIAMKILDEASKYGISPKDIIFDPLAMTVSADKNAALTTLATVRKLTGMGYMTSLGVSNVSFGLPARDFVNATFFAQALENGLSAAIINPYSTQLMTAYLTHRVLHGLDDNCADYIEFAPCLSAVVTVADTPTQKHGDASATELQGAIRQGLCKQAGEITARLLGTREPLDIVNTEIIPALDAVGVGFENKTVYLPQLLMSAEAAKSAFARIKERLESDASGNNDGMPVVLATVHGDIHDIGKNIVRLLLENYGFAVSDLGRDVTPEAVADEVERLHAPLVGLSALMTTTVPAMEETIKLLRERTPWCKVAVGGAVLNKEYADRIGADRYCKDAMQTVRYAEEISKR